MTTDDLPQTSTQPATGKGTPATHEEAVASARAAEEERTARENEQKADANRAAMAREQHQKSMRAELVAENSGAALTIAQEIDAVIPEHIFPLFNAVLKRHFG